MRQAHSDEGEMAEWSIAAVLKTVELRGSGGSNPSLSATQNENESDRARFFVYRHMDINWLNGNMHRYKKEGYSSNFFILCCTGCPWQRLGITKKSLSHAQACMKA